MARKILISFGACFSFSLCFVLRMIGVYVSEAAMEGGDDGAGEQHCQSSSSGTDDTEEQALHVAMTRSYVGFLQDQMNEYKKESMQHRMNEVTTQIEQESQFQHALLQDSSSAMEYIPQSGAHQSHRDSMLLAHASATQHVNSIDDVLGDIVDEYKSHLYRDELPCTEDVLKHQLRAMLPTDGFSPEPIATNTAKNALNDEGIKKKKKKKKHRNANPFAALS